MMDSLAGSRYSKPVTLDSFCTTVSRCDLNIFQTSLTDRKKIIINEILSLEKNSQLFFTHISESFSDEDTTAIKYAYYLASLCHHGQMRKKGMQKYFEHPIRIASIAAYLDLKPSSIIAALLHDVIEDSILEISALATIFGTKVTKVVNDLTQNDRSTYGDQYKNNNPVDATDSHYINLLKTAHNEYNNNTDSQKTSELGENIKQLKEQIKPKLKQGLKNEKNNYYYPNIQNQGALLKVIDRIDYFYTLPENISNNDLDIKIEETITYILPLVDTIKVSTNSDIYKRIIKELLGVLIPLLQKNMDDNAIIYTIPEKYSHLACNNAGLFDFTETCIHTSFCPIPKIKKIQYFVKDQLLRLRIWAKNI